MHDLVEQFGSFGLNYGSEQDFADSESDLSEASEPEDNSEEAVNETHYVKHFGEELKQRADLHGFMGYNEVLYSKASTPFKGICVDSGAMKSTGGLTQYKAFLKIGRAHV